VGFGAELKNNKNSQVGEMLRMIQPEDLLQFGLIPELIGRLPINCIFDELNEEALFNILIEPRNALTKQYKKLFLLDEVELEFDEAALKSIVKEAIKRKTGARALRAIMEDIMLDIMFMLPDMKDVAKCVISKEVVEKRKEPEFVFKKIKKTA
jgi:ATP-dependent Clp protease ATP-binding subunit ClpX